MIDTDHSVLRAVIREHLEPFLKEVADRGDGRGLPRFDRSYAPVWLF